jgi:IS5 family transposase
VSICISGLGSRLISTKRITIEVSPEHPLIQLMNTLDWQALSKLVINDLKKTTSKLKWWLGRKLKVRVHLGIYLLQHLLNARDRDIIRHIKDNAVYQVFCGEGFVKGFSIPAHAKISEFRSRLSPETQCELANSIAKMAVKEGFADPKHVDIDSTVQKPDMQHPASINLLVKTAIVGRRIQKLLKSKFSKVLEDKIIDIDLKEIKGLAKEHYFEKRKDFKTKIPARKQALSKLWSKVSEISQDIIRYGRMLTEPYILESLNKRDRNLVISFIQKAPAFLTDIYEHCYDNVARKSRIFSYYRDEISCFNKNKHHKGLEFGRQFQIGRVEGNFVFSVPNHSIRMPDAESFKRMLAGHIELFKTPIESISTDKGYYSKENEQLALDFGIKEVGTQRPNRKLSNPPDNPISEEAREKLYNRRSGIEPIISHLKSGFQMGRSRAKTDRTTEASGFASMLGFNLRQMVRYLTGEAMLESANECA